MNFSELKRKLYNKIDKNRNPATYLYNKRYRSPEQFYLDMRQNHPDPKFGIEGTTYQTPNEVNEVLKDLDPKAYEKAVWQRDKNMGNFGGKKCRRNKKSRRRNKKSRRSRRR
jgi:hypothetical protein